MTVTSDKLRAKRPFDSPAGTTEGQAEAAFERVFLEQYPRVYGVLFRLVGDRAEAEDLALETFWRLHRQPPRNSQNIGGWLYRVAINLGLNSIRAGRRRQQYEKEAGRWENQQKSGACPEEVVAGREARRQVREILWRLPPRQTQLLLLRHSGLSYREIAEAVGVAPGSVGTLLARAEKEFARLYQQVWAHQEGERANAP